jgi:hypothetical protein
MWSDELRLPLTMSGCQWITGLRPVGDTDSGWLNAQKEFTRKNNMRDTDAAIGIGAGGRCEQATDSRLAGDRTAGSRKQLSCGAPSEFIVPDQRRSFLRRVRADALDGSAIQPCPGSSPECHAAQPGQPKSDVSSRWSPSMWC